jgi:hypothetical protein
MTFLTRFQQLLEIFWRNQQVDLNILVHDRLKNPVESIGNTIKLFNYYHTFFSWLNYTVVLHHLKFLPHLF